MTSVAKDSKKAFKFCEGATRHDLSLSPWPLDHLAYKCAIILSSSCLVSMCARSLARSAALSRQEEEGECANMYTPYRAFTSDSALRKRGKNVATYSFYVCLCTISPNISPILEVALRVDKSGPADAGGATGAGDPAFGPFYGCRQRIAVLLTAPPFLPSISITSGWLRWCLLTQRADPPYNAYLPRDGYYSLHRAAGETAVLLDRRNDP